MSIEKHPQHVENQEPPSKFVPLVPSDAAAIILIEHGRISWVPAQMPKELLIDINYFHHLQKQLALDGKIKLVGMYDSQDAGVAAGGMSGGAATGTRVATGRRIRKSEIKYDPNGVTHEIQLNTKHLKEMADGNTRVLAELLSEEIQRSLLRLTVEDIKVNLKEDTMVFLSRVVRTSFVIAIVHLFVKALSLFDIHDTEIGINLGTTAAILTYILRSFSSGRERFQKQIEKREILLEKFEEFCSFFKIKIEDPEDPSQFNLSLFLFFELYYSFLYSQIVPGLTSLPRGYNARKVHLSTRKLVKPENQAN